MTIDEAIAQEKELAKKIYMQGMLCHANPDDEKLDGYIESGKEHEQLAEWLEELKALKNNSISIEAFERMKSKSYKKGHRQGYKKAIDDFVKLVKKHDWNIRNRNENAFIYGAIDKLAEQLKADVNNEYNI